MRGAKQYTAQQILNLAKAIEGDVVAYNWLKQNHCLELAAVCCGFLNYDSNKSLDWLHKYQFRALWCFIDSFEDNQDAFEYLKFCNQKEWGATYCAALGDNNAIKWLVKNKFNHYVFLSKAIFEHFERYQNRRRHRGGLIWSVLDDSSDGFDGFGGGDFGGGGAGGDW